MGTETINEKYYEERFNFSVRKYLDEGLKFIIENKESIKRVIEEYKNKGGKENGVTIKTLELALEQIN